MPADLGILGLSSFFYVHSQSCLRNIARQLFLLSHLIFLILLLILKNSLAFPIELYYI